jgi:hypothetical protein
MNIFNYQHFIKKRNHYDVVCEMIVVLLDEIIVELHLRLISLRRPRFEAIKFGINAKTQNIRLRVAQVEVYNAVSKHICDDSIH